MAQNEISPYEMIVIGGSAGSLEIVMNIAGSFTSLNNCTLVIILHRKNERDSLLQSLLSAKTNVQVREVEDKEPLKKNTIYLAPPDYHLLFESKEMFSLDSSEKIHFSRPSIDVTFESAAQVFGAAVIGILLSGANADGAAGLNMIQHLKGRSIVQDPQTAEVDFMPQEAIRLNSNHDIVKGHDISSYLKQLLIS